MPLVGRAVEVEDHQVHFVVCSVHCVLCFLKLRQYLTVLEL